jgi:NADH:ubiquinone reductase (H+-translocating)
VCGLPTAATEHAWPLYTLADAVGLRTHMLGCFERVADEAQAVAATITAVVVGGGPTGVETAAALATMAREVVGPIATLRVILVEADSRLPSSFSLGSSHVHLMTCAATEPVVTS